MTLPGLETEFHEWRPVETIHTKTLGAITLYNTLIQDSSELPAAEKLIASAPLFAWDTEGSGLQPKLGARICGHAFAYWAGEREIAAYYLPIRHCTPGTQEPQLRVGDVSPAVSRLMTTSGEVVGHHLKYDVLMGRADEIFITQRTRHDTMTQAIIRDENEQSFGLKNLTAKYVYPGAKDEEEELESWMRKDAKRLGLAYKKRSKSKPQVPSYLERYGYSRTPVKLCGMYACHDVAYTLILDFMFRAIAESFPELYARELNVAYHMHEMEWHGLPINTELVQENHNKVTEELEYLQRKLDSETGVHGFEVTDASLGEYLYETLGLEVLAWTKKGAPSTGKDARTLLKSTYPKHKKLLDLIDQYMKVEKARSTYTESLLRYITPENTIHPSYNQIERKDEGGIPVTGRLSSANPNAQNFTKKAVCLAQCLCEKCAAKKGVPEGPKHQIVVREYFYVPGGYVIVYIDLSQIEVRTIAWFSQDPVLVDCYQRDDDIHAITSAAVTGGDRDLAKRVVFGNNYGQGAQGLARHLPNYTTDYKQALKDAERYLDLFFEQYAGIPKFRDRLTRYMQRNNCMFVNPFGRPRRIPEIASRDKKEFGRAQRMMMSSIISGTAADLNKEIMLRTGHVLSQHYAYGEARMLMTIHDEISFLLPIKGCTKVIPKLFNCFVDWPLFEERGIPIRAGMEVTTTTWADKKEIELCADGFCWGS